MDRARRQAGARRGCRPRSSRSRGAAAAAAPTRTGVDGSWVLGDDLAISAWLVTRWCRCAAHAAALATHGDGRARRRAFSEGALKHSADGGRFADDNMRRYVRDLPYVWREAHRVAGHDEDAIPTMPGPFAGWHAR